MTYQSVMESPRFPSPTRQRVVALAAIPIAAAITRLSAEHLRRCLEQLRRGARPATYQEALACRDAVVSVSLRCASREGCLLRSVSAAVACRLQGRWPTWSVGVQTRSPFGAHAWIEVDGHMVNELIPDDSMSRLFSVPPIERRR
ncbi:lasso peptide biosynthesis B2 protein [Nocardia sp. NPDC056541]|uniref:lasso peptide biosynthesis B2 protein n=1 Tax=Nocardia sp. NPDC056541 TaxID=3345860 RepID=UPI0036734510